MENKKAKLEDGSPRKGRSGRVFLPAGLGAEPHVSKAARSVVLPQELGLGAKPHILIFPDKITPKSYFVQGYFDYGYLDRLLFCPGAGC